MWGRALIVLVLLGACKFTPSPARDDGGADDDDAIDSAIDTPPDNFDPLCFGGGDFGICLDAMPSGNLALTGNFDTTKDCPGMFGAVVESVGTTDPVEVCAIAADRITIDTLFGIGGGRPLVLIAVDSITIAPTGELNIASGPGGAGPGIDPPPCVVGTIDGTIGGNGGGGGAGGSFGSAGGAGGQGNAGAGGSATGAVTGPIRLRGGCSGGAGQIGSSGGPNRGGLGGGVALLIARTTIVVEGTIDASGSGAPGTPVNRSGGGGGGSGGMIAFHTTNLMIAGAAHVFANGGGGAGGSGNSGAGGSGDTPSALALEAPADGGRGTNGGASEGGNGAAEDVGATAGSTGNGGGGGGGGGGIGVIRVLAGAAVAALPDAAISPPPTN